MRIELTVDGSRREPDVHPGETLLEVLRREGFTSVKNGCAQGDCGTCAVLLEGRAVNACLLFAAAVDGAVIETVESLAGPEGLDPLQLAALDTGAVQCGFCTPGILLVAKELLDHNPEPTEREVREALSGNLCRCTGYTKIIEAVLVAAAARREGGP